MGRATPTTTRSGGILRCLQFGRKKNLLSLIVLHATVLSASSAFGGSLQGQAFHRNRATTRFPPSVGEGRIVGAFPKEQFLHPHPLETMRFPRRSIPGKSLSSAAAVALATSGGDIPVVGFDNGPFLQFNAAIVGLNGLGFLISLLTGSHLHLDLLGTGAFAVAALPTLLRSNLLRIQLSSAAVVVWGTKLASFLFYRALQVKHDGRLDETLSTVGGTALFWTISTVWGSVCSLPHALGSTSTAPGNPITLGVGAVLYVAGLLIETVSDLQKWRFKKSNPGKFCTAGLWSVSQHPNFFGNLLLWAGILVMNCDSLVATEGGGKGGIWETLWGYKRIFVALLSPLFMWFLFYGQATGSVANAVELANKKYGSDPDYQRYIKSVPLIIPNVFKRFKPDK